MKILMATMSMGLGGAETHILELSRELARRGHTVFVASNGGVYAEELCRNGITHCQIPLHSKNPALVAKAVDLLSSLMEKERFDIVHAHARIPAFICGKLREKYGFAFITTAHFDFRVDPLLSKITDWGERMLAVSEDIAESVAKKYGYPPEKITVVNNGIDTAHFTPENDGANVRGKLGLEGKKVAMYLGRLDEDSYLPAKTLLESAEAIFSKHSDARIVIVGEGEKYGELCESAKAINDKVGFELALLTGGTTDAAGYIAACDAFVGPSRSAMEALASGKPTVVAGAFGMLGIFSPKIADEALRTNFCCRGSELPTAQRVGDCVNRIFNFTEEERAGAVQYGRTFIAENYSVRVMTDVCEREYRALIASHKKNVVICGYYGYGNIGDELMLNALVRSLSQNENVGKICVMSADPRMSAEKFCVQAVPRFDIQRLNEVFAESDTMIFGGGNILQDKTSTKSLVYYTHMIALARKHACRVALCANGIGPILQPKNMKLVEKALHLADYISMRDESSRALAIKLTGREDIFGTSDLSFACEALSGGAAFPAALEGKKYYVVFPKKICGVSKDMLVEFFCKLKCRYGLIPVFAAMHKKEDALLCRSLAASLPWAFYAEKARDAASVGALLSGAEFSFCMRLHAVMLSVAEKCPVIALSDDGKLASFFSSADMEGCAIFPAGSTAAELFAAARKILKEREHISAHLEKEAEKHRKKAFEELERLNAFLG